MSSYVDNVCTVKSNMKCFSQISIKQVINKLGFKTVVQPVSLSVTGY